MKELTIRLTNLTNKLEKLYQDTLEHEEKYVPDRYIKVGEDLERAYDLLEGFMCGNYEDCEVGEAKKLLKYWKF